MKKLYRDMTDDELEAEANRYPAGCWGVSTTAVQYVPPELFYELGERGFRRRLLDRLRQGLPN